ncbi:MAG: ADP-ribosylation/crystallin J1 [Sorangiineae bacterium]|nr:ADP-ribosylation/crystallin J1 [Polyangiaceae bacterium]MEB2322141.1 ADP-ribosylation/crystallin J1 [Sorangiineae bacterium]
MKTRTLYRPVGAAERTALEQSRWTRFPPRLVGQPHFVPVRTRAYAERVAREASASGASAYVTRFEVSRAFLDQYAVHVVGERMHEEYRIPAEELEAFNDAIVGDIEVVSDYPSAGALRQA